MSVQMRNQTSGLLETVAGYADVDLLLSGESKNPVQNKTIYNALALKVEKTVNDLVNYYTKTDVYNKSEVRQLIGAINTLTIEVVENLPTQDISTTTIYFVPGATTGSYDEYIYVNNAWVQIGDTQIDLSDYVTSTQLSTALQDYYSKLAVDALLASYYTKTQVDTELNTKQDTLTFDEAPTAGSNNPVKSGGIKTAIDNIASGYVPFIQLPPNVATNASDLVKYVFNNYDEAKTYRGLHFNAVLNSADWYTGEIHGESSNCWGYLFERNLRVMYTFSWFPGSTTDPILHNFRRYPEIYNCSGLLANDTNNVMQGYGVASVILHESGLAEVQYQYTVTTAGSGSDVWAVGLNANLLSSRNSSIPTITPIQGGTFTWFDVKTNGTWSTFNETLNGFAGRHDALNEFWQHARNYDGTNCGAFPSANFANGARIHGVAYGLYDVHSFD